MISYKEIEQNCLKKFTMTRKSISLIKKNKNIKKITCLTASTSYIAKIIDKYVDIILIGDSLGMTIYGMSNTQSVTLDMMRNHGKAVCNSSSRAFTVIDMPYKSYRNKKEALKNAKILLEYTNCQSIKLETDEKNIEIVEHLTKNKIKVISHIGVTPQKYKNLKKIHSVGKNLDEKIKILDLAIKLQKAGSCMIVLECVDENLAKKITHSLKIPTIGIGASLACDGQVLVTEDILNISSLEKKPRFIKTYTNLKNTIEKSVKKYVNDVINLRFPKKKNTY